jgi:hypothetical protein
MQQKRYQGQVLKQKTLEGCPHNSMLDSGDNRKKSLFSPINLPYNLKLRVLTQKLRLGLKITNGLEMIKQ